MRYILEKPDFEFFSTLFSWAESMKASAGRDLTIHSEQRALFLNELPAPYPHYSEPILALTDSRVQQPVLSIQLIEEGRHGLLVDINSQVDLLSDIRKGNAFFETQSPLLGIESPVVVGPYDVLDGTVLTDKIDSLVFNKHNIESLGLKELDSYSITPYEDCSVKVFGKEGDALSISSKEIEEELSFRKSSALGNYAFYDVIYLADNLSLLNAEEGVQRIAQGKEDLMKGKSLVEQLCDSIENYVHDRDVRLMSKDFPYSFISEETKDLIKAEQFVISTAESLNGVKYKKDLRGKFLGRSDGFDVVIKERPGGEMFPGNDKFLSIMKDGKPVGGYVNLVRGNADEPQGRFFKEVVDNVYNNALKRAQKLEKYESFKSAIGLKSFSKKIK